jgi:hypothetical protein
MWRLRVPTDPKREKRVILILRLMLYGGVAWLGGFAVTMVGYAVGLWLTELSLVVSGAGLLTCLVAWVLGVVEAGMRRRWIWFVVCLVWWIPAVVVFALVTRSRDRLARQYAGMG